jgi:hypothetical protein
MVAMLRRMPILAVLFWCTLASSRAVERVVAIEAPATAAAGSAVSVVLAAATDAGQGERIGLFQADYSLDDGRTWTGLCYLDNLGAATREERSLTAGPTGSVLRVRLRVAFRDGLAGDVDYAGAAIRWNAGWAEWAEPPARSVAVTVK